MAYTKTNWVNGTTPLNDKNMNKIENELENLDTNISKSTDEYSSTSTYSIGELVIYNNKLYKANQDITTAEAFNSSHWTEVTLLSDVNEIKSVVNNNADNLNNLNDVIDAKANSSDVYTKTETDTKLKAKANTSDVYTKTELDTKINAKQDKLIAGTNITISNNTISAKDTTYSTATSSADGLMSKKDKSKLDNIFNSIYPVGSIYMSVKSTNPSNLFGGTWTQIKDRFLLACGSTYKAGATGGEATHRLTQNEIPNYSIGNIPAIVQDFHEKWNNGGVKNFEFGSVPSGKQGIRKTEGNIIQSGSDIQYGWKILTNGGEQAHNNMPPYLSVYIWQRTA